jgi:hypothetical protein
MGIHEGAAQLSKATRQLLQAWNETRLQWDDPVSRSFEERYLDPLQADARKAAEALGAMAALLERIRCDCT